MRVIGDKGGSLFTIRLAEDLKLLHRLQGTIVTIRKRGLQHSHDPAVLTTLEIYLYRCEMNANLK